MSGIILYWITELFAGKNNLIVKSEIKATNKKLIASSKVISVKDMIRNNLDIKSVILRLFFVAFWIDIFSVASIVFANIFYSLTFIYNFFGAKLDDFNGISWPWIGELIINLLFVLFVIRMTSDYYKLSLRSNYRNNYLKLIILDILTLNILNIIGTLVFIKTKKQMIKIPLDYQINRNGWNSQAVRDYLKLIFKIEIFILVINLIIFSLALITGYFVRSNGFKWFCLIIIFWNIALLYGWSIPRMIAMVMVQKMFKNLLNNDYNYYYLLFTIRFLVFGFGYYYLAIFINLLNFNQSTKDFLLTNW